MHATADRDHGSSNLSLTTTNYILSGASIPRISNASDKILLEISKNENIFKINDDIFSEWVSLLQKADLIVREEILDMSNHLDVWQYFAVLLPIRSVGVMGDDRTYDNVITVRAVESLDGMTADWFKLPYDVMDKISNRIINEVRGVNRVCYDISSKPPSTIEWE